MKVIEELEAAYEKLEAVGLERWKNGDLKTALKIGNAADLIAEALNRKPRRSATHSGSLDRLVSTRFQFTSDVAAHDISAVTFDRMQGPFYKGVRWAVRRDGYVLNAHGDWEYEPIPSSRDDAFFSRCRFESLEAAVAAYDQQSANDLRQ